MQKNVRATGECVQRSVRVVCHHVRQTNPLAPRVEAVHSHPRGTLTRRSSPPERTHPQSGAKASSCFLSSMLFHGFSRSWTFSPTCQWACHSPNLALILASCSASFSGSTSTPGVWLSASMTHLGSTFTTCTRLFDKRFDGRHSCLPAVAALLLESLLCDVLFHFVCCTFCHYSEGIVAYLPCVSTPCLLVDLIHTFWEVLISSDIFGQAHAFSNTASTHVAKFSKQPSEAFSPFQDVSLAFLPASLSDINRPLGFYLFLCNCTWPIP